MEHGPSTDWGDDRASTYKTRLGIWMFLIYLVVYAGFVAICSVRPDVMARLCGGMSMAIVYGFGLIVLAMIMAVIYNALSGRAEEMYNTAYTDDEEEAF